MGLQTIINNATFLTVEYNKLAAQSFSRSGRLLTAELVSAVPFKLTVGMHEALQYSQNRALLAELGELDITTEEQVNIGTSNPGQSYVLGYQGDSTGIAAVTCVSASGKTLTVNASGAGSGTFLFKKGDYIQPGSGYRYPYIVTADVAHTTSSSVAVSIHRAFIPQSGYSISTKPLATGVNCNFKFKMISKPSYSVVPYDRLAFGSNFELVEVIRKQDT
tara:strand:- start:2629 stop:3285 length:657 start_codon:yes stop_codon:yes gene_type:complete